MLNFPWCGTTHFMQFSDPPPFFYQITHLGGGIRLKRGLVNEWSENFTHCSSKLVVYSNVFPNDTKCRSIYIFGETKALCK